MIVKPNTFCSLALWYKKYFTKVNDIYMRYRGYRGWTLSFKAPLIKVGDGAYAQQLPNFDLFFFIIAVLIDIQIKYFNLYICNDVMIYIIEISLLFNIENNFFFYGFFLNITMHKRRKYIIKMKYIVKKKIIC